MKNWLLRNALLPLGDWILGHPMMKRLRMLEEAQWWSPPQLKYERERVLRKVVQIAYAEVPFYRDLLSQSHILPETIRTLDDLRRLPVVTKSMLRAAYPLRTCRPTGRRTYETATSGSTGQNFRVREDYFTAGWYRASSLLSFQWAGWTIGEPHLQTGMAVERSWDRRIKDHLMGCHYFLAYQIDDERLDRCLDILDRRQVNHLWGYPCSLFYLAKRARQLGFNRKLKSVVTWGDQVFPHYRTEIEAAFQTDVHDTYGCGEGMQIAAQCGTGAHYHVHALDVIVEILDDAGQPVPEGIPGNIVITRLHAGPMPFIRYQLGDVGVAGASSVCSCGRGFPTINSILGRTSDVIITPSGNRLIVHFFTGILEHFPEIDTFQVVQRSPQSMCVRVVPTFQYGAGTAERIRAALRSKGADLEIQIEMVDKIPLTAAGKRRFIVRES